MLPRTAEAALEMEAEPDASGRKTGRTTARKAPRDGVVEVVTRGEGRRTWSPDQKRMIVVEAMQPGATPTEVIRRWGLCRFLDDGTLELDTNSVEREIRPVVVTRKAREIRPVVVTRKAALFAGSEGGGENWAIATTLIRTAILNGVNPQAWLTDALERMVGGEVASNALATLLPWTWRGEGTPAAA